MNMSQVNDARDVLVWLDLVQNDVPWSEVVMIEIVFAVEIVETGQHLYHDAFCRVLCEYLAFIYDLGKQSSDEIVGYKVLVFSSINGYTSVINV